MTKFENRPDQRPHLAGKSEAAALERRLHDQFKKFEGRSLADELIAERREEARWENDNLNPPRSISLEKGGSSADGSA